MAGKLLDDILANLAEAVTLNSKLLVAKWQWEQKKESDKTPDGWVPTTAVVFDADFQQVLGHNAQRDSIYIYNSGPASVALTNRQTDATEAANLSTVDPDGGVFQFVVLATAQSVTIGTRGAVYAYSLGYGTGDKAVLSLVETVYSVPQSSIRNPGVAIGYAGLQERGLDQDAEQEHRQRPMV
jgi:hypothetical protein